MHKRQVRQVLQDVCSEDEIIDDDNSDSESDNCEDSDHNTASAMSDMSVSSDDEDYVNYYIGRDKITKWRMEPRKGRVRICRLNTVPELLGVNKHKAKKCKTPLECFSIFIDDNIIRIITECTNIKIDLYSSNKKHAYRTDETEIKALIGLLLLAGSIRSGHQNIRDLWDTKALGVDIFRTTMSYHRFSLLLTCLRFDDVTTRHHRRKLDKLAAIRDVFDIFLTNCQESYLLSEYCTIDEQLVPFRGRCSFRQYIPNKPAKYGIKIFTLADANSRYTFSMEIYVGIQPEGRYKVSNKVLDVVMRLVQHIEGSGRNVTGDNWFSSIPLAKCLLDKKLSYVGTIRKNKKELPKEFVTTKNREPKSSIFGFQDEATIVSYIPKKNRNVLLISTLHVEDNSISISNGTEQKPQIISFYNNTKVGVDTVDELCGTYSTSRKSNRWPLVIFFRILDIAGINSQTIYNNNKPRANLKRNKYLQKIGMALVLEKLRKRSCDFRIPREIRSKAAKYSGIDDPESFKTYETDVARKCV
ncbi:piggyBac transposable element-derived protein 4-like isoform X2 [Frieseomelitta varia]|uniref:piggyBac transposable element-derived protein 4-like isoform X2 n=1 Tax=Frieseomelitta varia TaxID=561572 RepID=UPI001CB69F45|nr:piggyBac transposable element-derived protein 4-like isoform X2 [Frieseomelitta varia]